MTMRESIEPDMTPVGPEREFTIKARTQGQMVRRRFIRHRGAAIGFSALVIVVITGQRGTSDERERSVRERFKAGA